MFRSREGMGNQELGAATRGNDVQRMMERE